MPEPAVLYLDDDAANLAIFRIQMDSTFKVATALSVAEAVGVLEEGETGAVLLDHRIPDISGASLAKLLRYAYPTIPRILVSAYLTKEDCEATNAEADLFSFVPKPWEVCSLRHVLELALRHHETLCRVDGFSPEITSLYRSFLRSRLNLGAALDCQCRTLALLDKR